MTNKTPTFQETYFIDNFPQPTKDLFYKDPKKFKVLYKTKLSKIVRQDLLKLIQFVTPVYEIVHYSDWYDSWHEEIYWYKIKTDKQESVKKLFGIYCNSESVNNEAEVKNKDIFNLLRIVYFYTNYGNKAKWEMSGIATRNRQGPEIRPEIYTGDFIKYDYNLKTKKSSLKMKKKKSELSKQIDAECEKIADKLIDKEIARIVNINEQIRAAKATLAKYGTELVKGY